MTPDEKYEKKTMRRWVKDMEYELRRLGGTCPECENELHYRRSLHSKDCKLWKTIEIYTADDCIGP